MCCELRDISAHYSCIITISSCYNGSVCHLPFIAQPTSMGGTPSATLWRWEATSTTVYYAYKVESHGDLAHKPWYPGSSAGTPPGGQHTIVKTHVIRPTGSGTLAAPLLPQRHGSRLTTWVAFPCPRILLDSGSGRRQQRTVDSTSRWRARSKNIQKARSRIAGDPGYPVWHFSSAHWFWLRVAQGPACTGALGRLWSLVRTKWYHHLDCGSRHWQQTVACCMC